MVRESKQACGHVRMHAWCVCVCVCVCACTTMHVQIRGGGGSSPDQTTHTQVRLHDSYLIALGHVCMSMFEALPYSPRALGFPRAGTKSHRQRAVQLVVPGRKSSAKRAAKQQKAKLERPVQVFQLFRLLDGREGGPKKLRELHHVKHVCNMFEALPYSPRALGFPRAGTKSHRQRAVQLVVPRS